MWLRGSPNFLPRFPFSRVDRSNISEKLSTEETIYVVINAYCVNTNKFPKARDSWRSLRFGQGSFRIPGRQWVRLKSSAVTNYSASVIIKEKAFVKPNVKDTEVLLIKRGQQPKMGFWSLPGVYLIVLYEFSVPFFLSLSLWINFMSFSVVIVERERICSPISGHQSEEFPFLNTLFAVKSLLLNAGHCTCDGNTA